MLKRKQRCRKKKRKGRERRESFYLLSLHLRLVVMMELNNAHKSILKNTELYKCQVAVITSCLLTLLSLFWHVFSLAWEPEKGLKRELVVINSVRFFFCTYLLFPNSPDYPKKMLWFCINFLCHLTIILDTILKWKLR